MLATYKCRGGLADVVRVTTRVAAIDAAAGLVNKLPGTMPTVRTLRHCEWHWQPSPARCLRWLRAQLGPGSAAALLRKIAQLTRRYREGAAGKIEKKRGDDAAGLRIEMKLHLAGDEDITQFRNNYALRISA